MEFLLGSDSRVPRRRPRQSRRSRAVHLFDSDGQEVIDLSTQSPATAENRYQTFAVQDDDSAVPLDVSHFSPDRSSPRITSVTTRSSNSSSNNSSSYYSSFREQELLNAGLEFETGQDHLFVSGRLISGDPGHQSPVMPYNSTPVRSAPRRSSDEMTVDEDEEEEQVKRACLETMTSSQGNNTMTDDSVMCTICFDSWTSSGPHRIISLKCGHIFGLKCIEQWMLTTKKCPTCQAAVRKPDIRNLYVRSLKAIDTSERESLTKQIADKEKEVTQIRTSAALDQLALKNAQEELWKLRTEVERLKKELLSRDHQLQALRAGGKPAISHNITSSHSSCTSIAATPKGPASRISPSKVCAPMFQQTQYVPVCSAGGCRVMASCRNMDTIAISLKNPDSLYKGYGVRRISVQDYKMSDYLSIHADNIFDMCFKPHDPLLLTASSDKTMKLTALGDRSVVSSFELSSPARSCCWHPSKSNSCFVGLSSGGILGYDIRYPSVPTHEFDGIAKNPLISVQFVHKGHSFSDSPSQDDSFTGLLCNSLTHSYFFEIREDGDLRAKKILPFEGKLLPSHFDQDSGYGLISIRPSEKANQARIQHHVIQLSKNRTGVSTEVVQQFYGGSKSESLSRSKVFANPESFNPHALIFAADESNSGILLYNTEGRKTQQIIKNHEKIMDIDLVTASRDSMQIAALTDKGITFYNKTFMNL